MERRRIILVETEKVTDAGNQFDKIESKIDALEKKISAKWVMPVLLVLLTTLMGVANYFVQRYYSNSDIYSNKLKEKIAELQATEQVNFFKHSIVCLDTINTTFESYCRFGPDETENKRINISILRLNTHIANQLDLAPNLKKSLKNYINYVALQEIAIENENPDEEKLLEIYKKSNTLYTAAMNDMNATIIRLTK